MIFSRRARGGGKFAFNTSVDLMRKIKFQKEQHFSRYIRISFYDLLVVIFTVVGASSSLIIVTETSTICT